jgi:hypothetical protein
MAHKNARTDLTAEYLRAAFSYDPESGLLKWRYRDDRSPQWNGRYAGKKVGSPVRRGLSVNIEKKRYLIHRVIWVIVTGDWPKEEIDHQDVNYKNNIWTNLREATSAQNMSNQNRRHNNTSGYKGVYWDSTRQIWRVTIMTKGKSHYLGSFRTAEEGHREYCRASALLHGEFANHG